jgi:hypothetical protein
MDNTAIRQIYKKLNQHGYDSNFIKSYVLPFWWDEEITTTKAGFAEFVSYISKNLGIQYDSLKNLDQGIQYLNKNSYQYKKNSAHSEDDLEIAKHLAIQVAKTADKTLPTLYSRISSSATELRQILLNRNIEFISFQSLVDYSWEIGIPVIHLNKFPKKSKKMDAVAIYSKNRPVIVLSNNKKHPSWHLFNLAHEIGHIALGHLNKNEIIFDTKINRHSTDKLEIEANQFALELLSGDSKTKFQSKQFLKGEDLATEAAKHAVKEKIDPGFIVLNYAYHIGKYGIANNALHFISSPLTAQEIVKAKLRSKLKNDNVNEEEWDYFLRLTELED